MRYRSGLRGKCPIEIKIAMKQAVQGGVIFSRTEMDGILTSEKVPPQYIISIAEDNKVIWSRAESNLEPSTWTSAEA
jgi:RNA:NAD 2'-phosphotransferase (TPT1/KptA family)